MGVVSDPTFHKVTGMLFPENCVNLAKFIIEVEKVKGCTQKLSNLYAAEKGCNLQETIF